MKSTVISPVFLMSVALDRAGVLLELPGIENPRQRMILERVVGMHPDVALKFFSAFVEVWRDPGNHAEEFDVLVGMMGSIGRPGTHTLFCTTTSLESQGSLKLHVMCESDRSSRDLITLTAPKKDFAFHADGKMPTAHPWKLGLGAAWNGTWTLE